MKKISAVDEKIKTIKEKANVLEEARQGEKEKLFVLKKQFKIFKTKSTLSILKSMK